MRRKLTAVLALTGTACTTMRVQTEPAPVVVSRKAPNEVELRLRSGERVRLHQPKIVGDSIVGLTVYPRTNVKVQRAVAQADVESLSIPKVAVGRTVGLIAVMFVAVVAVAGGSSSSSSSSSCESAAAPPPRPA